MSIRIELPAVRQLLDQDAQLVDVLPESSYAQVHLRGAVSLPLKRLDATTAARLDPARPLVVYCNDYL